MNNKFELPNWFYSTSDIQDYFEFIVKRLKTFDGNPQSQININKIKNRITFKISQVVCGSLLAAETVRLLGSKKNITKDKNSVNVPHLEITELVLVCCDAVCNDYQNC